MKLLPLTTRKQLPNPHRVSHQVSKSTHLCMITREDNKWCDAQNEPGARLPNLEEPTARQSTSCCFVKKPSLPVNDNGVWGGFVSVATTFLVTASAAEQLQRAGLKQTSAFILCYFSPPLPALGRCCRDACGSLARLTRGRLARLQQTLTERAGFWQAPISPVLTQRGGLPSPFRTPQYRFSLEPGAFGSVGN